MQNMTLAIGPGTPASAVIPPSESEIDEDEDEDEEDFEEEDAPEVENSSEDADMFADHSAPLEVRQGELPSLLASSATSPNLEKVRRRLRARGHDSSIRHDGCINTACWLDVPWRFSTVNESAGVLRSTVVQSWECPTQIATSGDDRLLKIWDCAGAMGMDNPLPGGWNTICPFSTLKTPEDDQDAAKEWQDYYAERVNCRLGVSGTTRNLATISTSHRGNVFHVTPLRADAGKFLTCGADGFLRQIDCVSNQSTVVVDPSLDDEATIGRSVFSGTSLAYSHVMLSPKTGLLCSERGLHRFDLRLSTREQQRTSLIKEFVNSDKLWRSHSCKACAVWRPNAGADDDMETTYVFAGGSSASVGLFDLRMDGSRGRIIERYKPEKLSVSGDLSVSGLDVTKGEL
jgi:hypothetical protein